MSFDIFQAVLLGTLVAIAMTACVITGVLRLLSTAQGLLGGIALITLPIFIVMFLLVV